MEKQMLKNLIKYGTVVQLGQHTLLCGSCQDKELMDKYLKDQTINSVNSDVPYAISVVESKQGFKQKLSNETVIQNDHLQSDEEYIDFNKKWIEVIKPHLAEKNSFYIFNSDKMIFALREAMKQAEVNFSQMLIWIKNSAVIGRKDYLPAFELIAYGWYGTHKFYKSKDKSLLFYPKPHKSPWHPTSKPPGLIRQLILNSTKIGDTVFDGFLGGGTCLLACEQTKRKCIGVEIEPEHCISTILRWQQLTHSEANIINNLV
jgi:DNA modification methylase